MIRLFSSQIWSFGTKKVGHKYKPLIISGTSGAGKTTMISYLINAKPQLFQFIPSYTTRHPREGQVQGRDYHFCTVQQFENLKKGHMFIENCIVHGNMYGTHQGKLKDIINKSKVCILDVDIQGGQQIHSKHPDWNFVFLRCGNIDHIKNRLEERGADTIHDIQHRLSSAKKQLNKVQHLKFYDIIKNDIIEDAKKEIAKYVNKKYSLNLVH